MTGADLFKSGKFRMLAVLWIATVGCLLMLSAVRFSLGLWVYQVSGSISALAVIGTASLVPAIIFTPIGGVLVDKMGARAAIALSSGAIAITCIPLYVILETGIADVFYLAILVLTIGTFYALQIPAYHVALLKLVPRDKLDRANALFSAGASGAMIVGPLVGGFFMQFLPISRIIAGLIGAVIVQLIAVLSMRLHHGGSTAPGINLFGYIKHGVEFIRSDRVILNVFFLGLLTNTVAEMTGLLLTPLGVTHSWNQVEVGMVIAFAGCGSLAGSVILSIRGGFSRQLESMLVVRTAQGMLLVTLSYVSPDFFMVAAVVCGFFLLESIYDNSDLTFWQHRASNHIAGVLLSFRDSASLASALMAYLLVAPFLETIAPGLRDLIVAAESGVGIAVPIPVDDIMLLLLMLGFCNLLLPGMAWNVFRRVRPAHVIKGAIPPSRR